MRSGDLRHVISIQELSDGLAAPLPSGAPDQYWSDVALLTGIAAQVKPLSGRELFAAQEYSSEVTHRVRIRAGSSARSGITNANRVRFGERYFTIHNAIDMDERGKEIHLLCSEGLAVQV